MLSFVGRAMALPRVAVGGTAAWRSCRRLMSAVPEAIPRPVHAYTEEEKSFRQAVSDYAQVIISGKVAAMDAAGRLDREVVKGLFEQGFMGLMVGEEHGGLNASFTAACLVVEELAKVDPSAAALCEIQNMFVNAVVQSHIAGHEETLSRLASESLAGIVFHYGAMPGSTPLTVQKAGDGYVLNGAKAWCTAGDDADMLLVMAKCDHSGSLMALIVNPEEAGKALFGDKIERIGLKAATTTTISFKGAKVPSTAMLGAADEVVKDVTSRMAISGAVLQTGLAKGIFDYTVPYLHQRRQFGKAIADFQAMQHQRAQAATDMEASRLLAFHGARLCDMGRDHRRTALRAAQHANAMAQRTSSLCIEWLGGVGFTKDFPAEKYYRDSMAVPYRLPLVAICT